MRGKHLLLALVIAGTICGVVGYYCALLLLLLIYLTTIDTKVCGGKALGEWKRGIKAGLISGVIYGVFSAVLNLVYHWPVAEVKIMVNEVLDLTITYFLQVSLYLTITGAIAGLLFASAVLLLPGKTSIRKGLALSLILWAFNFVPSVPLYLSTALRQELPTPILFQQFVAGIAINPKTGVISWLVFGVLLGFLWDKFSPKQMRRLLANPIKIY